MSLKITGILLVILMLGNVEAYASREKLNLRVPMAFEGKAGMGQEKIAELKRCLKEAYRLETSKDGSLLKICENLRRAKMLYAEALRMLLPGNPSAKTIHDKIAYLNRRIETLWKKAIQEEEAMNFFSASVATIVAKLSLTSAYVPELLLGNETSIGDETGRNKKEPMVDDGLYAQIQLLLNAGWTKKDISREARKYGSYISEIFSGRVKPDSASRQEILEALERLKKKELPVGTRATVPNQDAEDLQADLNSVISGGIKPREISIRSGVNRYTLRSFITDTESGITVRLYQKLRAYLSSL